jgi:hypothetical protein
MELIKPTGAAIPAAPVPPVPDVGGSKMNYFKPKRMRKTENKRFKHKRSKRKHTAKRYRDI